MIDKPFKSFTGGLELGVKKGVAVTFFKVGPDIHLEYGARFYLPDIQPEHLGRVFKNFKPSQVHNMHFPPNLEQLLSLSSKNQIKESSENPSTDPVSQKSSQLTPEAPPVSTLTTDAPEEPPGRGQCPLCQGSFSLASLEQHAASCGGSGTSLSSG